MNTPLITMDEAEAKQKMEVYRSRLGKLKGKQVAKEISEQYEAIMRGYKALAKGTPLLDLEDVMKVCGHDAKGRPRLAICAADGKIVNFSWRSSNSGLFRSLGKYTERHERFVMMTRPSSSDVIHRAYNDGSKIFFEGYAHVPLVPADVRPKFGTEKDWYVLWEVEKWADERREVLPDRDPYLLKFLGGSLYAVIAEWDLTDLERSVMKQNIAGF